MIAFRYNNTNYHDYASPYLVHCVGTVFNRCYIFFLSKLQILSNELKVCNAITFENVIIFSKLHVAGDKRVRDLFDNQIMICRTFLISYKERVHGHTDIHPEHARHNRSLSYEPF